MPNSKRRKRLVASNKKQIERARRRIEAQTRAEADKENAGVVVAPTESSALLGGYKGSGNAHVPSLDSIEEELHRETNQREEQESTSTGVYEAAPPGWLGGLYSWCHSGIVQVCLAIQNTFNRLHSVWFYTQHELSSPAVCMWWVTAT